MLSPSRNHPFNCGTPTATFARQFAKRTRSSRRFDINSQSVARVSSVGTATPVEVDDRVLSRQSGATTVSDFVVEAETIQGAGLSDTFSETYVASSDPPGVFNVTADEDSSSRFLASHLANGAAAVRIQSRDGETQSVFLNATSSTNATVDTFVGWKTGSLARHIWDGTFARLEGRPPIDPVIVPQFFPFFGTVQFSYRSAPFLNVYSEWPGNTHVVGNGLVAGHQNPAGPWVRNPECWLADVDLSCVSAWNIGSNGVVRATAVSPEHWVSCKHGWEPKTGDTLYFVGHDAAPGQPEQVSIHTVTATVNVPNADIRVGRISPPLPEWVSFARVLPKNNRDHLPFVRLQAFVPAFKFNQDFQVLPSTIDALSGRRNIIGASVNQFTGDYALYRQFTNVIRFLDSGNPTFCVINGEAVLLSVHTTQDGGPFLSGDGFLPAIGNWPGGQLEDGNYEDINAAMTTLGGGYQLTPIDLSAFPTY